MQLHRLLVGFTTAKFVKFFKKQMAVMETPTVTSGHLLITKSTDYLWGVNVNTAAFPSSPQLL